MNTSVSNTPNERQPSIVPNGDALERVGPLPVCAVFALSPPNGWQLVSVLPVDDSSTTQTSTSIVSYSEFGLFKDEAEGYYLNLESPEPSIFIKWRLDSSDLPFAVAASVSYNEAGRWLDASEWVDRVPMPEEMLPWLAEFTQTHYEPEGKKKKRGAKPSFMPREQFAQMAASEAVKSKP